MQFRPAPFDFSLKFRRWRRLRGIPPLSRVSREGAIVRATGFARSLNGDDPFVAPVAGVACVVAWAKYFSWEKAKGVTFERLHIRPFVLEAASGHVLVDSSHVELLFPISTEGNTHEISVAEGQLVTIIGSVLRDGAAPSGDEIAFRDTERVCKLVGSKSHPIVITQAA